MPGRSRQGSDEAARGRAAGGEEERTQSPGAAPEGERVAVAGTSRRKRRGIQVANAADGVVFAIYTHTQERERYRALAERLKVTHGELLTLLLDMTEDLLEQDQLEVRFTTVTVRKTKPEYVLKMPRGTDK